MVRVNLRRAREHLADARDLLAELRATGTLPDAVRRHVDDGDRHAERAQASIDSAGRAAR